MFRSALFAVLLSACSNSGLTAGLSDDSAVDQALYDATSLPWVPGGAQIVAPSGLTCSGMFVSDHEVLTAAHCVAGRPSVDVCYSDTDCSLEAEVVLHPEHAFGSGVDLAVVRLQEAVEVQRIYELPSRDVALDIVATGVPATVFGFGLNEEDALRPASKTVEVFGADGDHLVHGGGICRADDGGGVVAERGEHAFLLAVATGGEPCAAEQSVSQGLWDHMAWLTEVLDDERVFVDDHRDTPFTLQDQAVFEGSLYSTDVDTFLVDLRVPGVLDAELLSDLPMRLELLDDRMRPVALGDELPTGLYHLTASGWWGDEVTDYIIDLTVEPSGEPVPDLVITEVNRGGPGDYTCQNPAFVEVVNAGTAPVELGALTLQWVEDGDSATRGFPDIVLEPGLPVLLTEPCSFGPITGVPLRPLSWNLGAVGDVRVLRGSSTVDAYPDGTHSEQFSMTRASVSRFEPWVRHDAVSSLPYSRGRDLDGQVFELSTCPIDADVDLVGAVSGSTLGAEDRIDPICADGRGGERLHHWVAPSTGCFAFTTSGSSIDTILSAHSSCLDQELACNDDTDGTSSRVELDLDAGDDIVLAVSGWGGDAGDYDLVVASCD